ncbi:AraC-like DNA-binding protein [Paenibacillus cellulosilyticus]|uniref:AraC-like DNA-binding protein n=1 Tax=Paenibacillus cellulosilyticus TaxID=375489 RepID=A0A2V2YNA6_9BACL|nr:AraC family transcriptional regulator [Paenibacillus cellulosilyticus]PWV97301.1 AraC-like DNA-binding protein [Paenibacillus cellulosilyticus]QKS47497.1 helix-turn-helix transcriptional regulator [Paenibacillus cellulosilyticus]
MAYDDLLLRRLNQIEVEHALSGISRKEPGWTHDAKNSDLTRLFYPVNGKGWLRIEQKKFVMEPGYLYLLPGAVDLAYGTEDEELVFYWTHFKMNIGGYQLLTELDIPFVVAAPDTNEAPDYYEKLIELQLADTLLQSWRTKAVLLELMACFLEGAGLEQAFMDKRDKLDPFRESLAYIEEHLSESISIEQLASIECMHPNYFTTIFKSVVGSSPVNYMNERRLELARTMLSETTLNVADIASRVGMQNHYLSRMFKQQYGITPRRYRELSQSIDGTMHPNPQQQARVELAAEAEVEAGQGVDKNEQH